MRFLYRKNIQVTVDDATLRQIDRAGKPLGMKRSQIVREALQEWLKRRRVEQFEPDWIASLRRAPDDVERADDWTAAQEWSR